MATNNWNSSYESTPADGDNISEGAGKIRDLKLDVRERIGKDHYMDLAGTQADHGEHSKVTFQAPITTPTAVANKGFLYTKDVLGKAELHFLDDNSNESIVGFASGTRIPFHQVAAPTGWTQDTSLDDYMLRVIAGGGGGSGGTDSPVVAHYHSTAGHILSLAEMPAHNHQGQCGPGTGSKYGITYYSSGFGGGTPDDAWCTYYTSANGGNGSHTHGDTGSSFSPKFVNMIICTKN